MNRKLIKYHTESSETVQNEEKTISFTQPTQAFLMGCVPYKTYKAAEPNGIYIHSPKIILYQTLDII